MSLERELTGLVEFPAAPDITGGVLRSIARRRRQRRRLVLALAAAAVALAAALAASPARTTILDWFGIGGVRIERVPRLPDVPRRTTAPFGRATTLAAVREQTSFPLRLPRLRGLGDPAVYVDDGVPGLLVTFVYGGADRPRLLLSQWHANTRVFFYKLISYSTQARRVRVDGHPGVWVSGAPHAIFYKAGDGDGSTPVYLAGNVLVWMEGPISYRLELEAPLEDALRIATSLG